jgi:lipopolysaccharide transport system permease protein
VSASFRAVEVRLEENRLRIHTELANRGPERWSAEGGWAVGYHLFDDPTGTLVVDGERAPLELAPGETQSRDLTMALPPEPGEYAIYLSVVQENVAWFYSRGWPFILIDVSVDDSGAATLRGSQVVRWSAVRRRRLVRATGRALVLPLASIWRNRALIRTLVRRDVLSRYSGSFAGAFWALLNPLLLMLTYFFVFGLVLNSKFGNDPSRAGFALYFLAGMLPWLAFSEAVGRAPTIMIEHRNFIKKLVFPVETLPVNLVAAGLVTEGFGVLLFVLALLIIRHGLPASVLYLPALVAPQILFTAGICWFLAGLGVFVRDLAQVNGFLLTIWFFITPICYPETALPKAAATLLRKNPMYILVRGYRAILLEGSAPDWSSLTRLTIVSVVIFLAGHAWFYKLRKSFADII